ncbi:MAG: tryptophan--tRNA ligase [bacterium]
MAKKRILSGMRPSGKLHVGHLLGALSNWAGLQGEYECFYMVADWHALTTEYENPSEIKANIREMVIDWISSGLDPEKSTMFVQSQVVEHAELHLLLSMFIPLSWLERCPTYKQQQQELKDRNLSTYGFLGYPVLQAADILVYKAEAVPVGEDQLPHVELCREIARRFNLLYRNIFPEPQALLTKVPKLLGTDGRKMSKSYNNCIFLSDPPQVIREKVGLMITDPSRIRANDPGHPDVCTVYGLHKIFSSLKLDSITTDCKGGKIGCVVCKEILSEALIERLKSIQAKRRDLEANPEEIVKILKQGRLRAQKITQGTLKEVREAIGL